MKLTLTEHQTEVTRVYRLDEPHTVGLGDTAYSTMITATMLKVVTTVNTTGESEDLLEVFARTTKKDGTADGRDPGRWQYISKHYFGAEALMEALNTEHL